MLPQLDQQQFKDAGYSSMIITVKPIRENQEEYMERRESLSPDFKKMVISESTYYETHHPVHSQSPVHRKWVTRKQSQPVSSSPIRDRQIVSKKTNFRASLAQFQDSTQQYQSHRTKYIDHQIFQSHLTFSPKKQSLFRTRLVKLSIPSSLELRPVLTAQSYYAGWADGGEAVFSSGQSEQRQMASLTKIMTAYTVISLCKQYNIKVREEWIPIHSRAHYMEGTSANLKAGEEILLIDLLYGLLLPSGNDAGIALAQYFGKFLSFKLTKQSKLNFDECADFYDHQYERQSVQLFVFEMNRCALRLGLTNTHFDNPTGLTNANNYSTAKDIFVLTSTCLKNHLLRLIFRRKVHKCEVKNDKLGYNRQVVWHNTNKQLYRIRECLGVKTGITPGAGPCLSAAYRIGSRELVVVVLNCHDLQSRFQDAQQIYRWCRKQFIN